MAFDVLTRTHHTKNEKSIFLVPFYVQKARKTICHKILSIFNEFCTTVTLRTLTEALNINKSDVQVCDLDMHQLTVMKAFIDKLI